MWLRVADFLLKYRIALLIGVVAFGLGMGYIGLTGAKFSQKFANVIPPSDPDMAEYLDFRARYGEDGGTTVVGLRGPGVWHYENVNALHALAQEYARKPGIARTVTFTQALELKTDTAAQRFELVPHASFPLANQAQADSLRAWLVQQPFYAGLLYSPDQTVLSFSIGMDAATLDSKLKHTYLDSLQSDLQALGNEYGYEALFAGLPYMRHYVATALPVELGWFSGFAILFTAIALFLFYRSFYSVIFPLVLLVLSSLSALAIISLLGYELSVLMGMLPPVIIILGVPPNIYMLSDYHEEYRRTGNKIRAIRLMVRKLGMVTLMINANTAFGFLTLWLTGVKVLQEFGLAAFLSVMTSYVLTIILVPCVYSLLPPPTERELRHLKSPRLNRLIRNVDYAVQKRGKRIFVAFAAVMVAGSLGILWLKPMAHMSDELPKTADVYDNQNAMDSAYGGVYPFEVVIDTKQPRGAQSYKFLKQTADFQDILEAEPTISKTVALPDLVKWGRQALAGGDPAAYSFPLRESFDFIQLYTQETARAADASGDGLVGRADQQIIDSYTDSTRQEIRVSGYVADIGSDEMKTLLARVRTTADSVYQTETAREPVSITLTGVTRIFLKSNEFLLNNLVYSLIAIFCIIGLQMLLLFGSWRIMLISLGTNLIPLALVAGLMGYFNIHLKPATALIYQLAFGIAIDDSIHFLTMYRHYRKQGQPLKKAISESIRHTGMSIIYTSVVLFMGFIIFAPSAFNSTSLLGTLTSLTLFIAMFCNLLLLPALLLRFDRDGKLTGKAWVDEEDYHLPPEDVDRLIQESQARPAGAW